MEIHMYINWNAILPCTALVVGSGSNFRLRFFRFFVVFPEEKMFFSLHGNNASPCAQRMRTSV